MTPHELIIQTKSQCSLLRLLIDHLAKEVERDPQPTTHENLEVLQSTYHILQTLNTSLTQSQRPTLSSGIILTPEGTPKT